MSLTKTQLIIIGGALLLVLLFTLMLLGVLPGLRKTEEAQTLQGSLTIWGVRDSEQAINSTLIADYQAKHPNVKLTYIEKDELTYEEDLINALAAGTGPDIFMIHNTWLPEHFEKLSPLTPAQFPTEEFRGLYPAVVEQDFTAGGAVYALPLHIDTLALVSNSDILDNAGIAKSPTTWEEIIELIPQLRTLDSANKITTAAVAIGGSLKSVTHASDILSALMLQEGVQMTTEDFTRATFALNGASSLRFYTNFANSATTAYTWNDNLLNSFDSFSQEKVAMILAYGDDIAKLRERNPFLRLRVSNFPQPKNARLAVTYPSYWGLAVSNKSPLGSIAWNFIFNATANETVNKSYLDATNKSPALRSLIGVYTGDTERGVFARQALTARSWRQIDQVLVSQTFSEMIQSVLGGTASADKAIQAAQETISAQMRRKNQQ